MVAALVGIPSAAHAAGPQPGTPEYFQRDNQNIADAYGRQTAPDGQLGNPHYLPALIAEGNEVGLSQLAQQAATPNHVALTPGNVFVQSAELTVKGSSGRGAQSVDQYSLKGLSQALDKVEQECR